MAFFKRIIAFVISVLTFFGISLPNTNTKQCNDTISWEITNNSVIIELKANYSTGYSWDYTVISGKCVSFKDKEYICDNPGVAGAGGTDFYTFEIVGDGTEHICFIYSRPFETNGDKTIINLELIVKNGNATVTLL